MKNIYIVDNDVANLSLLNTHLKANCFNSSSFTDCKSLLEMVATKPCDLIIMEIILPEINGVDVCKLIREKNIISPILILSHATDEATKINAMESGADDYVTKPFSINELIARIRALLRRSTLTCLDPAIKRDIHFRNLSILWDDRIAFLNQVRLDLTIKEFDLLYLLASNPGKTFKRKEILEIVWGYAYEGYEQTLTSHINRLRLKVEQDLHNPRYIITTWGIGYRFAIPDGEP